MIYITQFIFSFIATVGFGIFYNIPRSSIFYAGLTGSFGWIAYFYFKSLTVSPSFSNFMASIVVGLFGEIFARIDKKPVTVFVIPGIIPLVPGYGIYLTMISLIQKDFNKATSIGFETIFVSGAIAIGVILISSFAKIYKKIKAKNL